MRKCVALVVLVVVKACGGLQSVPNWHLPRGIHAEQRYVCLQSHVKTDLKPVFLVTGPPEDG